MNIETGVGNNFSKRKALGLIYDEINMVATPGDLVFFISEGVKDRKISLIKKIYRKWQGFDFDDLSKWHTTIYTGKRKESKGSQLRPYILHATEEGGVEEIHVTPSYFTSVRENSGGVVRTGRIEVVHNPDIGLKESMEIVDFARSQLGKPFEDLNWRYVFWTYALGLPTRRVDPNKVSCHGLAYKAYEKVGVNFRHHLEDAPFFNVGKYLNYPLFGHPRDKIDTNRLYLVDHHLYRDKRFESVLTIFEDNTEHRIKLEENPGKYSWNRSLRVRYGV